MNAETKHWAFTWDTNVNQKALPNEKKLISFLNQITETFTFQKEEGTIRKKHHYQGVFTLLGSRKSKKATLDIFQERFENVSGLTISKVYDKVAIESYVTKQEGRVTGPFQGGRLNMFDQEYADQPLQKWQHELFVFLGFAMTNKSFRDRRIIWVQDLIGNTGKSYFQKWLRIGQKDIKARKLPVSSTERLISAVTKINAGNEDIDLYMINLTRTQGEDQSYKDLFASIEDIKDGYVVDTMYGKYIECIFKPPVIIIFANKPIDDFKEYLSLDRWTEFKIDSDKEISHWNQTDDGITIETLYDYRIKFYEK